MKIFYQRMERHETQLQRAIPEIVDHEKRINCLEDRPGKNAIKKVEEEEEEKEEEKKKLKWAVITGAIGLLTGIGVTIIITVIF